MQVYSSTYRNVIESLRDIILSHPAVKTFRVGPPSTIEMPTDETPAIKYPYVHLIPQPATLDGKSTMFDFDLIVMDLAKDQLGLEERTQSSMLEITRDIIAYYTRTTWEQYRFNMILPVVSTPFVEEFQNSAAGWTTQIKIEAMTPLSNCENPVMGNVIRKPTYAPVRLGSGSDVFPEWSEDTATDVYEMWLESVDTEDVVFIQLSDVFSEDGKPFEVGTKITNINGRVEKNLNGNYTMNLDLFRSDVPTSLPLQEGYAIVLIINGVVSQITLMQDILPN